MSEVRKVVYDEQLKIEAYQFQGIMQKFPNHFHAEQVDSLRILHQLIMDQSQGIEKEELYYFLMQELIEKYSAPISITKEEDDKRIEVICEYIKIHYAENISLDELRKQCGMNKYVMLRNFAAQKGITPYQYIIATRINVAMKLLEVDNDPLDVALKIGFTDQSHFSNAFKRTIGLTPGQYKMIRKKKK